MREYAKLFRVSEPSFHILNLGNTSFDEFKAELRSNSPSGNYLAVIDGNTILNKDDLLSAFANAFDFPSYFGRNWDALDECLNDLEWLKADSYVLIIRDLKQMRLSGKDQLTLLNTLSRAAREWTRGRSFNPSFVTLPTPFHIVFVVTEKNAKETIEILELAEIPFGAEGSANGHDGAGGLAKG